MRMRTSHRFRSYRVRAVPGLLLSGSLAFDLLTPAEITPTPVLAATPAVALGLYSLRGVLVTVAATLAAEGVLLAARLARLPQATSTAHLLDGLSVLLICAAVVVLGVGKQRAGRRMASLSTVAETAQRAVLPLAPERVGGMPVAVSYRAAHTDALVGGDAYAVEHTAHGVRLMIADVRGKGLGAVRTVAALVGAFRTAAHHTADLAQIAAQLEYALVETAPGLGDGAGGAPVGSSAEGAAGAARSDELMDGIVGENFATAVLAEIPASSGDELRIINLGHPAPILLADGKAQLIEPSRPALPLGLGGLAGLGAPAGLPAARTSSPVESVAFPPGASLVLYTDGLSEARDDAGTFLDPIAALGECVTQAERSAEPGAERLPEPRQLIAALTAVVARHTGNRPQDDTTILALQRPR